MAEPSTSARGVVPAPGWPDRAIAALAERQGAAISYAQLRRLGASSSAIDRAVRRGRLHRVHRGVYSLVPLPVRPPLAAEHAARLACGPRAVLSHSTAARLHGLRTVVAGPLHLTLVGTERDRPGLIVHRTQALHPGELVRVGGLPVTSVARTVVDESAFLSARALEEVVDRALRKTSRAKLSQAVARHSGRPGVSRVHALLDPARPSADTWSEAERRLRRLIITSGLPAPESNVPIGRYTPDLLWRAERVIVEYDSDEFHSGPAAVRWDTGRHNHFTALRYAVIHATREELRLRPERILVQIATALAKAS